MTDVPRKIAAPPRAARGIPRIRALGQAVTAHEDLYHLVLTQPWWQFFLGTGGLYLLANALFATVYLLTPGSIANARPGSFQDAFFFSVQTMATIGYGTMAPVGFFGNLMVTLEAITGMLGVALVTGITFAKFARPTARVLFADKICVGRRDGQDFMMFRMANWRHNQIVEAQLRVSVLVTEVSREGESLRRPHELKLVRDRTAFFALTFTAMHALTEDSPFFGPRDEVIARLRARDAQIFLALQGQDETFASTVHARHTYDLDAIVWDGRFADVLSQAPDGTRIVDYRNFHRVVPLEPPPGAAAG